MIGMFNPFDSQHFEILVDKNFNQTFQFTEPINYTTIFEEMN